MIKYFPSSKFHHRIERANFMKIQFFNGGLANQAFQYIFARYYELSHPGEIMYLDDSYFALNTVHNGYELEKVFGIKPHLLSDCFDDEVWTFILEERRKEKSIPQILCENGIDTYMIAESDNYRSFNPFDGMVLHIPCNEYYPEILDKPDDIYYHGYWINKNWFATYRAEFLKEFCFPDITGQNREHMQKIQATNSVSMHIRRGDYVTLGWAFQLEDYRNCVNLFTSNFFGKNWNLFIFSDDIPWCREHRKELGLDRFASVTFVEGNTNGKNYIDMQLMSHCKSMILSNSAFCYLAALLNTEMLHYINPTARKL